MLLPSNAMYLIYTYIQKKDKKQTNKKHDSQMSQYIISNIHVYVHCKHSINIEMILFRKHYTEYTRTCINNIKNVLFKCLTPTEYIIYTQSTMWIEIWFVQWNFIAYKVHRNAECFMSYIKYIHKQSRKYKSKLF